MASTFPYGFMDAINIVGGTNSELNKKKELFEEKYINFLRKYQVVGDKNFPKTMTIFPKKVYIES